MEQLAARAVHLNLQEADYGNLLSLFDLLETEEILRRNIQQVDGILNQLDVAMHTLSYALFLNAKVTHSIAEPEIFISQVDRFFRGANQLQILRITDKVRNICEVYTTLHVQRHTPASGIKTLQEAIVKSRKSSEELTPVHGQFVKLCLLAKCYHIAFPLLEQDVFEIDPKGTKPSDYMSYFYYGGMVYIGLKDFVRAFHFFKLAITIPASTTSLIMVESYKKFVLVSLIHRGNVPPFPPEVEGVVVRQIKNNCSHYIQLSEIFSANDMNSLRQFCEANQEKFEQDNNLGLLRQVSEALTEKLISMYTKCYVTLSLQDITKGVQLDSVETAEKHLLKMIEQGKICAVINLQDGMVNFAETPHKYNTTQTQELHKQIQKSMMLSRRLENLTNEMKQSEEFQQKKATKGQNKTTTTTINNPGSGFF